jgi:hypothetical protein
LMVVAPPAIPRPGIWARPIRGVRGDELRTHRMPAMPQDLRRPSHMQGEPADSASGHIRRRRHPRCSMACARLPAPFAERGCIQLGGQTPLPASRHRGHGWCRPWQAGSAAGRPGVPVLHRQPGAGALPALAAATASSSGTSSRSAIAYRGSICAFLAEQDPEPCADPAAARADLHQPMPAGEKSG